MALLSEAKNITRHLLSKAVSKKNRKALLSKAKNS
jgi:hypothetical protein